MLRMGGLITFRVLLLTLNVSKHVMTEKKKFNLKYHIFIKYARGIFQFPTNLFQISRVYACNFYPVCESINSSTLPRHFVSLDFFS